MPSLILYNIVQIFILFTQLVYIIMYTHGVHTHKAILVVVSTPSPSKIAPGLITYRIPTFTNSLLTLIYTFDKLRYHENLMKYNRILNHILANSNDLLGGRLPLYIELNHLSEISFQCESEKMLHFLK